MSRNVWAQQKVALERLMNSHIRTASGYYRAALMELTGDIAGLWQRFNIEGKVDPGVLRRTSQLTALYDTIKGRMDRRLEQGTDYLRRALPDFYAEAWDRWGYAQARDFGVRLRAGLPDQDRLANALRGDWSKLMNSEALMADRIQTFNRVKNEITLGIVRGEGSDSVTRRIGNVIGLQERNGTATATGTGELYKAARIARTEMGRLASQANMDRFQEAEEMGLPVKRVWITTLDDRTRDDHGALDQVEADENNLWTFPDGVRTQGPGLSGVAHHDINCFPGTVLGGACDIEGAYKRPYTGDLYCITTANGEQLQVTPNHPILTDQGWVPANLLNVGSNVVCMEWGKDAERIDFNVDHRPTPLGQIHDLLNVISPSIKVPGINQQFHGDGGGGEVDIVSSNGQLLDSLNSAFREPAPKGFLTSPDIKQGSLFSFSAILQRGLKNWFSSQRIVRRLSEALSFIRRGLLHSDKHRITSISRSDASGQESFPDGSTIDPVKLAEGLLGSPIPVTLDNIINIEIITFRGHVYNLQTTKGWYLVNNTIRNKGIVVHNCRCDVIQRLAGTVPKARRIEGDAQEFKTFEEWRVKNPPQGSRPNTIQGEFEEPDGIKPVEDLEQLFARLNSEREPLEKMGGVYVSPNNPKWQIRDSWNSRGAAHSPSGEVYLHPDVAASLRKSIETGKVTIDTSQVYNQAVDFRTMVHEYMHLWGDHVDFRRYATNQAYNAIVESVNDLAASVLAKDFAKRMGLAWEAGEDILAIASPGYKPLVERLVKLFEFTGKTKEQMREIILEIKLRGKIDDYDELLKKALGFKYRGKLGNALRDPTSWDSLVRSIIPQGN